MEKIQDDFRVGDTVQVVIHFKEGSREREQTFEGVVIARKKGNQPNATFTVRKISYGIGVERIFSINSPCIQRIQVVQRGKVRRAKLYYLRKKKGRKAKVKERKVEESPYEQIGDSAEDTR